METPTCAILDMRKYSKYLLGIKSGTILVTIYTPAPLRWLVFPFSISADYVNHVQLLRTPSTPYVY